MSLIDLSSEGGVFTMALNRPEKRNALSPELIESLHATLDALESDSDLRVLVIGGLGKAFCAGMDLHGVLHDPEAMGGMLRGLASATGRIRALPVPTIARVHGAAIGGGCGLAAVTDLAVTHPEAKLGYPEVTLGICPAVVAPWLIRKIGAGPARAMLLQGGTFTGVEAFRLGLVDQLVPRETLDQSVAATAAELAGGGQHAIAVTKRWLNELDASPAAAILLKGADLSSEVIAGAEAQSRLAPIYDRG